MTNRRFIIWSCFLIFTSFIIILLLASASLYREYSANQARLAERLDRLQLLLCEEIKLGMTKEQVIIILEEKGEMSINGNYEGPNLNLDFVYLDQTLNEYYGRFYIIISDYKYVSSLMPVGFEKHEIICSFR